MFGVATDDSHNYLDFNPTLSNPGRGWVMVRADEFSSEAVVEALASGAFYSSTGVHLEELEVSDSSISLKVQKEWDNIYLTRFIGQDGKVFAEIEGEEASYDIQGDEGYVRAVVVSSSGPKAWTQPIFPR